MNFAPFSRARSFASLERLAASARSIRGRLWMGSLIVVGLLVIAGAVAWRTLNTMSREITTTLRDVQTESRLASQLSSDAAKALEAGERYLDTRDPNAEMAFRQHGWNAHDIQRAINARPDRTADEVATVALIDSKLSAMEVRYARAHRLADLGRATDAQRAANAAQNDVDELLANIDKLGLVKAQRVTAASQRLADETHQRAATLLGLIVGAVIIALGIVVVTVFSIGAPLGMLVRQAQRLSEGDLTVRSDGDLPDEFEILAKAMNQTGDSLSRIVTVAAQTAQSVAASAHDLASVSEQISLSAGQMADAMTDVSHGAESQVQQLRNQLGRIVWIDEKLMNAATVLGACGTAYAMRYIRANIQGGIQIGFDAATASLIAAQTVKGAAELLLKKGAHPEQEIDKVTTPQGCTIAGLNEMEHQGFSSSLIKGVVASYDKIAKD